MKLENYGVFVISNSIMRRMHVTYLLEAFRFSNSGWDNEQKIRMKWIEDNHPDYYAIVKSGDIEAAMLFELSSDIDDCDLSYGGRAAIWINGTRVGGLDYFQAREFRKLTASFYSESDWARNVFLAEYPQFKNNMGKYIWVKRG